jgi:hypothetical protein
VSTVIIVFMLHSIVCTIAGNSLRGEKSSARGVLCKFDEPARAKLYGI